MKKDTRLSKLIIQRSQGSLRLLLLAVLFLQHGLLSAQCNPDVTPPTIFCPAPVTVNVSPGVCSTSVFLLAPTVSDNCPDAVTISSNAPSDDIYPLGTTPVTLTATDAAANTKTCQTTVTVQGGSMYTIVCNDQVTVQADPSGFTTLVPEDILEGGPYNCVQTFISLLNGAPEPSIIIPGAGTFIVECWLAIPGGGYNQCWGTLTVLGANCMPDVTPPVAVCNQTLTVQTNMNGPDMTIVQAAQLDAGSFDLCSPNLNFRTTLDLAATTPPTSTNVHLIDAGQHEVALWVGDQSGNWNHCVSTVTATAPKCNPDLTAPTCIAPDDITVTQDYYQSLNLNLQDSLQMIAAFGAVSVWDNCSDDNSLAFAVYSVVTFPDDSPKEITRSFIAIDNAGQTSPVAVQVITILPGVSSIHLPGWFYPGDAAIDSVETVSQNAELLASSTLDLVLMAACNGQKSKIERTVTIVDWLNFNPNDLPLELPALDLDNDGQTGDPYDVVFSGDSLWLIENGQLTVALAPKVGLYKYLQVIRYNYLDTSTLSVSGTVFLDSLENCTFDASEPILANWKVKAIGQVSGIVYSGLTDANGHYNMVICPSDTSLEVSLDVPYTFNANCPNVYMITLYPNQAGLQDIPVQLKERCPLLSVDLSTLRIRPCFTGDYKVAYCNLSDQSVQNVHIEVELDTFLQFNGASLPGIFIGGNTFDYILGTLTPGACGTFDIHFMADCNAPVGMTHCSEARIYPTAVCDSSAFWSGAWLEASGQCDGDSVRLSLRNKGSGPMAAPLDFVVIEDLIMYMDNPFQLGPGEVRNVSTPANGATWRIQSPQETAHPWGGTVSAFVEGCGGLNPSGASLAFPIGGSNPFISTDCQMNISSFDPNDKQAIPRGYGPEQLIEKNTDLNYIIRFQNTGTDTAYTVVLLDTLSTFLDPSSVTPGASSHLCDFDVLDGHILRFRFDNILLPDSSTNAEASHGFVKYHVRQKSDNANGSQILNRAGIYFDANAPVLTNFTHHTVGTNFILVETDDIPGQVGRLKVYPNPSTAEVFFEMPELVTGGRFVLTDAFGKVVSNKQITGNRYRFERRQLPAGVYFFNLHTDEAGVFSGKIMLK